MHTYIYIYIYNILARPVVKSIDFNCSTILNTNTNKCETNVLLRCKSNETSFNTYTHSHTYPMN